MTPNSPAARSHAPVALASVRAAADRSAPYDAFLTVPAIDAVESSFARIEGRMRAAVIAFHVRLLQQAPSLGRALPRDDAAERTNLANFFCLITLNLRHRERLAPVLRELGRRGFLRGVTDRELAVVKHVLIGTIADFDARAADMVTADAWSRAIDWVLATIRRG